MAAALTIKGSGSVTRSVQIPTGFAFGALNFWVSASSGEDNTDDFAGSVAVTLVCT